MLQSWISLLRRTHARLAFCLIWGSHHGRWKQWQHLLEAVIHPDFLGLRASAAAHSKRGSVAEERGGGSVGWRRRRVMRKFGEQKNKNKWQMARWLFSDSWFILQFLQCSGADQKLAVQSDPRYHEMANTESGNDPAKQLSSRGCHACPRRARCCGHYGGCGGGGGANLLVSRQLALATWLLQIKAGSNLLWSVRGNGWWWWWRGQNKTRITDSTTNPKQPSDHAPRVAARKLPQTPRMQRERERDGGMRQWAMCSWLISHIFESNLGG